MSALPSNSSITVDGSTIFSNASVVLVWQEAIANAIRAGESAWMRFAADDGVRSLFVTPASTVSTFLADADFDEKTRPQKFSGQSTKSNLAVWVDKHLTEDSYTWPTVVALGIDKDIEAFRDAAKE